MEKTREAFAPRASICVHMYKVVYDLIVRF
jgi:hypothetical protein